VTVAVLTLLMLTIAFGAEIGWIIRLTDMGST